MQQWQFNDNFNQLNMFRAIVSPILRSTRLCFYSLWYNAPAMLTAASSVHYTTSCKHSLVLLRMSETIARNMLSWLKLSINCHCCILLVVYIISTMHGHANIKVLNNLLLIDLLEDINLSQAQKLRNFRNCILVTQWRAVVIFVTAQQALVGKNLLISRLHYFTITRHTR